MGAWQERARQIIQNEADEQRRIQEEAAERRRAEEENARLERQRKIDERKRFSLTKAKEAHKLTSYLDQLRLENSLREIQAEVWNCGEVQIDPVIYDNYAIGKSIILSTDIPTSAKEIMEAIYRNVEYYHNGHSGDLGIPAEFGWLETKYERVGGKIIGAEYVYSNPKLIARYGFDKKDIESGNQLPDEAKLVISYANLDDRVTYHTQPFQSSAPNLRELAEFSSQALAQTCVEVMKDSFYDQKPKADAEMQKINARIGEVVFDKTYGYIQYTLGDRIRNKFRRE